MSQHSLVPAPIEYLQLSMAELVLVALALSIELKLELFHDVLRTCLILLFGRHADVDEKGTVFASRYLLFLHKLLVPLPSLAHAFWLIQHRVIFKVAMT